MRVLQISSAKNFGGGERHLADLSAGLTERGHDVFVALRAGNDWRAKLAFLPDERVLSLPLRNSLDFPSALAIAKFVKRKNVEIVHAHLARDYPIAALAARTAGVELVLTRHLLFPLNFSHKIILPKKTVIIAVSDGVRRQILKQKILPPEQIRLVYNGVAAFDFSDEKRSASRKNLLRRFDLRADSPLVGIAGEIAAHKGQTDFVRAVALVLKRFPEAEFFIAGRDASPQKYHENDLRLLIEKLELKNKVHLLGWLEDVAPFYSALDVFVSASRTEPFGLVIAEASASGACAVVATETDGAREIIEDGETGRLVSIGSAHELAEAITDFLVDEKRRGRVVANARRAALEKFGVERMVAETEKIYRDFFAETRIG